jgi:hypothetical protein
MPNESNRLNLDAFPRLERLLDAYADQLTSGPRAEALKLIDAAMPEIANALITAAKTGAIMAIRLCFELSGHIPPALSTDTASGVVQSHG